ncbi:MULTISPECIES: DoxX family protein [unclassified Variovorax]|uniref:DoxX family protein n=1 Tax=unclassified Variovorax TaxID=663243 RepID=UPI00076BDEAB|nr:MULTISPECIES: DoxX family protein [unclassified Variovorax]KWT95582.1 putative membrane protein [Variovorax sp. WDL1]PNG50193.1 hypothetical protein CHC06_05816 [Variovorax sp. B2]PNG51066.1 hypothetical protein CHC07_05722 [Variovorax sp. B4]VTU42286.1 DoxX [Variovorax sp. SRS16]VTU42313.1 DoxX [Variovorax sp. PBL-E5]
MTSDHIGKLLLRATLGGLMLFHGAAKILNGTAGIERMLSAAGLPAAFANLVLVGEVLAPALLLLGLFTRPAAIVIAVNMVVAVLLAHTSHLFALGKSGGWSLELQAFFFLTAVVIAVFGAGKYRIGVQRKAWWA